MPADVTVSAWVRNNGAPTSFDYILAKTLDGGKASYALYTSGSGGLFFFASNAGAFFLSNNAGAGIWDGEWHHVAEVYDSSGPSVQLYVDGVAIGAAKPGPAAISYASGAGFGDFTIGTYNGASPIFDWIGKIVEVRVYDTALTGAEILNLATAVLTETQTAIVEADDDNNAEEMKFEAEVLFDNAGPFAELNTISQMNIGAECEAKFEREAEPGEAVEEEFKAECSGTNGADRAFVTINSGTGTGSLAKTAIPEELDPSEDDDFELELGSPELTGGEIAIFTLEKDL